MQKAIRFLVLTGACGSGEVGEMWGHIGFKGLKRQWQRNLGTILLDYAGILVRSTIITSLFLRRYCNYYCNCY